MSHATLPQAGTHERPHPTVQLYVAIAVFLAGCAGQPLSTDLSDT